MTLFEVLVIWPGVILILGTIHLGLRIYARNRNKF